MVPQRTGAPAPLPVAFRSQPLEDLPGRDGAGSAEGQEFSQAACELVAWVRPGCVFLVRDVVDVPLADKGFGELIGCGWDELVDVSNVSDGLEPLQVAEDGGRVWGRVLVYADEEVHGRKRVFGLSKV